MLEFTTTYHKEAIALDCFVSSAARLSSQVKSRDGIRVWRKFMVGVVVWLSQARKPLSSVNLNICKIIADPKNKFLTGTRL